MTKYEWYLSQLKKETALHAYLDLSNMFHWQRKLKWQFRFEDVISQIQALPSVKEIKVYYGLNERDLQNSMAFHRRIRKTGAILRTKPMKFIRKTIDEASLFKRSTMTLFDGDMSRKVSQLVEDIKQTGIVIEEPKCNFDVEMTMDILDESSRVSGVILFSGDSDMKAPLERLKVEVKRIYIVGVRGMTAEELHKVKDLYIDFGQFYQGVKRR